MSELTDKRIAEALAQVEAASNQRQTTEAIKGCGSFLLGLIIVLWYLALNTVVGILAYQAW